MVNNSKHKGILVRILKDIYQATDIAPFLGFKGGTAVYVFYKLDRFSVDLDFDLIDEQRAEIVFEKVQNIIKQYGTVKDARIKRYSIFFLLSYAENELNIKIEINTRKFGSAYELKSYLGISMLVMKQPDIFAHKLVAMHERMGKANRDIYDVHFFLKHHWPINKEIVKTRTKQEFREFVEIVCHDLSKLSSRNILSGIGELITTEQKIWIKQNLLEDTVFLLRSRWCDF